MFRSPVITILGHVDHGKTTLLDFIRKSRLTEREHGGITQRIGAYEVATGIKGYHTDRLTFIDTPGHEAYSKLRARGADVADVALLIVDAKDGIKPQTVESISHIKAAKIPFIVVLNKIDLPEANIEKVKADLARHEVLVEDKGGKVPAVLISAKNGKGVPELLESILLLSSDLNLSFKPTNPPQAYVIETKKDKRGVTVSCIIKDGQMKIGDTIYAEDQVAKIRSMFNDLGKSLKEVLPSTPFELLGLPELPEVGTLITSTPTQAKKEVDEPAQGPVDISTLLGKKETKKLALLIKADTQGAVEAVSDSLSKIENVEIVLAGVGSIHKSDVFLGKTTGAIIIGFGVKPDSDVKDLAKQEKVLIKTYDIIYELLNELTEVTDLIKEKEERDRTLKGEARILATFIINNEKVFGVRVTKGKAGLGDQIELFRNNAPIGKSKLVSLKMRAKPVGEVKKDQEAGMFFEPELDIKVGDVIKFAL
jgi:translation initiation factor IF-2